MITIAQHLCCVVSGFVLLYIALKKIEEPIGSFFVGFAGVVLIMIGCFSPWEIAIAIK